MAHQFELTQREGGVAEWRHGGNGLTVLSCPTPVAPVVVLTAEVVARLFRSSLWPLGENQNLSA